MRIGLLILAVESAITGIWAAAFPRSFYRDFPIPGQHWISLLPAYNQHLIRDFGGQNLSMALIFTVAAVTLNRLLVSTASAGYLLFAIPHLVFHLNHLSGFSTSDAIAQVIGLCLAIALPLLLLAVAWQRRSDV